MIRACPNNNLGEPVREFKDTFSADEILMEKYFNKSKPTPLLDITYYLHGEIKRVVT